MVSEKNLNTPRLLMKWLMYALECRTIRTLVNSDLFTGQFGPWTIRTLVNSDLLTLVNSDHSLWSIRTSYCGQFGPRPLVNSDPDNWSIRTLTFCCVKSISILVLMIMGAWSFVGDFLIRKSETGFINLLPFLHSYHSNKMYHIQLV